MTIIRDTQSFLTFHSGIMPERLGKYVGPYEEEIIKQNLGIKVSVVEVVINLNTEKGGK